MSARIHNINDSKLKIYKERLEQLKCDESHATDKWSEAMCYGSPQETHKLQELLNEYSKEIHATEFALERHKGEEMSFIGAIKSAGRFFAGSPKTISDVFDKDNGLLTQVGTYIGNRNFTDEERAEMDATESKAIRKFVVDTLDENTERSKARRDIAVMTIKFYFMILFIAGMTYPVDKEWSAVWFNIATTPGLAILVGGVGAFFYGVHTLRARNGGKK